MKHGSWSLAVRAARGNRTQLEFSHAIGVTPMTVSRWERGASTPGKFTRQILARRYPRIFSASVFGALDAAFERVAA